jgi:hypothetical protein
VTPPSAPLPLSNRLDIHDRKQFELKLEYQPQAGSRSKYLVEMFMFMPASLNVNAETYPRQHFYADINNYVRLKTPVMDLDELLSNELSPLVKLERKVEQGALIGPESEIVYQAKLLSCVFRAALRRLVGTVNEHCGRCLESPRVDQQPFEAEVRQVHFCASKVLTRFRAFSARALERLGPQEKTRASLRLVDEYMSLSVEQFFRKSVADMEKLPRSGVYLELRRELMAEVIREEDYRKVHQLRSVLSPHGDNEEYMHRIGFLKKFCANILFLAARREQRRQGWEEMLFAIAAGVAMAFATVVAFWAQARFSQVSLNFFLIVVVGYMAKDRIKEGLRRIFTSLASRHLFDRATGISDPVTKNRVGTCEEKVDYGQAVVVPEEIRQLRRVDDFIVVAQGELAETVLRYQKQVVLHSELLPRVMDGVTGVTDIIRMNVGRLLRDMDDPEYAIEYVDLEEMTVGRVRGAKSYQVDLAFRFTYGEGPGKQVTTQIVRLVMDRNGIKRMLRFGPEHTNPGPLVRSVA